MKGKKMKDLKYYKDLLYQINTEPVTDSDGTHYWTAEYPLIQGCKTDGETREDAIVNVRELFDEFIETMLEENIKIEEPDTWTSSPGTTYTYPLNCS